MAKKLIDNPFCYGKTVDDPYFYGRRSDLEEIRLSMRNAVNLILYAPRRTGKSSLVIKALRELRSEGHPVVYIDFFKVTSREKFIELYSREIVRNEKNVVRGLKWLRDLIRGIQPVVGMDPGGTPEVRVTIDPAQSAAAFEDVINLPERLPRKKCWIIVFDEFQEIEKLNGQSFERELRAHLQHHRNAGYVFLGSQRHMLLNMFSRKDRAFFNFGKVIQLPLPTEEETRSFLIERFREGGYTVPGDLVTRIIGESRRIPYYVQYLGSELWETARLSGLTPAEIYPRALSRILVNQADYFQGIRSQVSVYQYQVLTAIARHGYGNYETDFVTKYRLLPSSSLQKAYARLTVLDLIERQENRYRITDPFFQRWIMEEE